MSATGEVENDLRRRVENGEFQPGTRLPRLADLMAEYGMKSRSAMDRALRALVAEGLLTIRQGSGIYVRQRHVVQRDFIAGLRMEYAQAIRDEVTEGGLFEAMTGTKTEVSTSYELIDADSRVAELLKIEAGTPLLMRTFRYTINGLTHQVSRSMMSTDLAQAAGLSSPSSERPGVGTIMQLRRAGRTPNRAQIMLETRMPSTVERDQLDVGRGTPIYEHWRVLSQDGEPLEVSTALVPGDRVAYVLNVDLTAAS
ncbi:GntR family transcriptional regulator [Micromonospora sp. NPDC051227]|uniref:GntR family transcriptional regulator n=1 Tax=Micromonospora sp. NPDC051227 TaxID=3364285 RepID=UPI0037AF0A69